MILVVDANIFFSVLLKRGVTSELILKNSLYAPGFLIEEFTKYKEYLKGKTRRTESDFEETLKILKRYIIFVSENEISPFLGISLKVSPDKKDAPYLALALKLQCPIWSNDKELKKQDAIKIISTEELLMLL